MKRIFVLLICLICVVGCESKEETITYKTISSEEAYNLMQDNDDVFVVDVRTEEEYASGHILNAINVPLSDIENTFVSLVTDNKDAIILVYCRSGNRSKQASSKLVEMGYKNVQDFGGISSWNYDIVQ